MYYIPLGSGGMDLCGCGVRFFGLLLFFFFTGKGGGGDFASGVG